MSLQAALILNAALALACWLGRLLSRSGSLGGFLIGSLIAFFLGWGGWLVLMLFFLGGTAATKFRYPAKQARGVAQSHGGQRRWSHAWANAGSGVACALASWLARRGGAFVWAEAWRWAFVACFAAALSDTLSSEFGQLARQRPWLITTGEEVDPGTDGGVTRAGILVGVLGAIFLTLAGRFLRLVPVKATLPLALAGLSGNLFDSYLGATLQRRGVLNNDLVNLCNTVAGALLGLLGFWLMHWVPGWLVDWGGRHSWVLDFFI